MKNVITACLILLMVPVLAQKVDRMEPPFWWAGMKNPKLQLMVNGENIAETKPELNYPGVEITAVTSLQSPNYLFIDLEMAVDAKPGTFDIAFKQRGKTKATYSYELKERAAGSAERQGFNTTDVLYLITPDRFANGDPSNDVIDGMREGLNRTEPYGRHGGDIRGIINSLDYLKDLGFTAIWVNPVLENDMEEWSYHGYSTTDFYKVDPRFGTNEEYVELTTKAKEKGIKVIMDMIVNHCGSFHWWMDDFPAKDWVNYQEEYQRGEYQITTHRKPVVQDPYSTAIDRKEFFDGWFVTTMPDMNQRNPYMATYLTQNSIWWIEFADMSGIRMDTYPYPDMDYMTEWTCAVMNEYPNFNIVGEEWFEDPSIVAYWQAAKDNPNGYTSCLPSLMDFPLQAELTKALNNPQGDWNGWLPAYTTLAKDFSYADPFNLVVFPDNHDMSRFYTQVNEDMDMFKLGLAYYTTIRGIPQFYYGTEVLMSNPGTTEHGIIRSDFPGGWDGDAKNAFSGAGMSAEQKATQNYFKTLLNWRKTSEAVHYGQLKHYNPKQDIYVLFRYTEGDKVMTILSKNDKDVDLDLSRFSELIIGNEKGKEIISGQSVDLSQGLTVPAKTPLIIDFD
ncbi:MAG: glycoside hydrolase family 13 protein [Cytophagales bacterium]|nr:glycoside hydrolase family 13 protein [Cytophagales bacterium]